MTDPDPTRFAERLIAAEPTDAALRRRYEQAIDATRERRLNRWQLGLAVLSLPIYVVLLFGLVRRLIATAGTQPREWLVLEAASGAGLLLLGLWLLRALLRGRVTTRDDQAMEWIGGVGLAAMALAFSGIADAIALEDPRAALRLHGVVTILLVGGALGIVLGRQRRLALAQQATDLELALLRSERAATGPDPSAPRA